MFLVFNQGSLASLAHLLRQLLRQHRFVVEKITTQHVADRPAPVLEHLDQRRENVGNVLREKCRAVQGGKDDVLNGEEKGLPSFPREEEFVQRIHDKDEGVHARGEKVRDLRRTNVSVSGSHSRLPQSSLAFARSPA